MDDVKSVDEIRVISEEWHLYLVNGRLVQVMLNAVDLNTEEGRKKLISTAGSMHKGPFGMVHGPYSVCCLYPRTETPFGYRHTREIISPKWLPMPLRKILRKEMPEHADEF